MNAMLAPAVTMMRLPRATSMPFSARELGGMALDERRAARRRRGTRAWTARPSAVADRVDRLGRRPVVDDALAERNRPGRLANPVAHDRDDRRLDGVHPRLALRNLGTVRRGHGCLGRTAGLFLLMVAASPAPPASPACARRGAGARLRAALSIAAVDVAAPPGRSSRRNSLSGSRSAPTTSSCAGTRSSST